MSPRLVAAWIAFSLAILALGAAALVAVGLFEHGVEPPFVVRRETAPPGSVDLDPFALHLAGSGSNLPLTRALAKEFGSRHPDVAVLVHESIGSTGGVRAAEDQVIDLGLISRELHPLEGRELTVIPYARVAVVFAAHLSVPRADLGRDEVLALYAGNHEKWSNQTRVVVLQRERGDSSNLVASRAIEGFATVDEAARTAGRWRVLYHDRTMQEALVTTPGAVGLFDAGAATIQGLPLRLLAYDGIRPTEDNVRSGRYPMAKPLAFVVMGTPTARAEQFLEFVFSPDGQAIIRDSGYVPVSRDGARSPVMGGEAEEIPEAADSEGSGSSGEAEATTGRGPS